MNHDRRLLLMTLAAGLPGVVAAIVLLWVGDAPATLRWPLAIFLLLAWAVVAFAARDRIIRPLQTLSNLLAALREDDFSIRARGADPGDALGGVMIEVNALAETLRTQRLGAQEAGALLRAVMEEIDVAIFALDSAQRLALVNQYGARLLGSTAEALVGRHAADLGLEPALTSEAALEEIAFPGGRGRWEIRRTKFWQGGNPHELLVLTDVSQPLREQERQAWQRLIRVIGHELNNSLAPIKSIAGSLESLLERTPPPDDWRDDMRRGLGIIASRADGLSRFTAAYARLARLPAPTLRPVLFAPLLHRVVALETRARVRVDEGPAVTLPADADQLEQLLINLVRNAVDAALETGGRVMAGWTHTDSTLEVTIEDEGPGLQSTANLFVPFFTTKRDGSGIGLALSRQIAEGHGGSLVVENRPEGRGARAIVRLPVK